MLDKQFHTFNLTKYAYPKICSMTPVLLSPPYQIHPPSFEPNFKSISPHSYIPPHRRQKMNSSPPVVVPSLTSYINPLQIYNDAIEEF